MLQDVEARRQTEIEYLNGGIIPWFVPKGEQKYTQ